jgi:hypothetical protein
MHSPVTRTDGLSKNFLKCKQGVKVSGQARRRKRIGSVPAWSEKETPADYLPVDSVGTAPLNREEQETRGGLKRRIARSTIRYARRFQT